MPLSEQEQRLLDEMERSLYHNDADFVATVAGHRGRPNYTVVSIGILTGILGIAVLIAGVVVHQPLVGVLGFAVMFAGVLIAATPPRHSTGAPEGRVGGNGKRTSFMQGLNDRWDKRQDERDNEREG